MFEHSAPSSAKSAERIEGAMMAGGAMVDTDIGAPVPTAIGI